MGRAGGPAAPVLRTDWRRRSSAQRGKVDARYVVGGLPTAAEDASMITAEFHPPRWAESLLEQLLRPADRESTTGDLLEEYRAARAPALGRFRANVWYGRQVLSFLWRESGRSFALSAINVFLAFTVFRPGHHAPHQSALPATWLSVAFRIVWYGSVVGAPGVSLLDAAVFFVAPIVPPPARDVCSPECSSQVRRALSGLWCCSPRRLRSRQASRLRYSDSRFSC